jgi:hypothetical protein
VQQSGWGYAADRTQVFVAVMLVTAIANRASAWLGRRTDPKSAAGYFALSATALLAAAAGLLRILGYTTWAQQAPWMMLIPIGYLTASRLWRGHSAERPLYWVSQGAAAVILLHVFGASLEDNLRSFAPMRASHDSLLLGLVFAEAAAFYMLAAVVRRRSVNVHLAAAALCGALWQFMGYRGIDPVYYTMLYSALGVACLAVARVMGLAQVAVYRGNSWGLKGEPFKHVAVRGPGLPAFQCGHGILCVALLAAFMQGLAGLAQPDEGWMGIASLGATVAAACAAAALVPAAHWRRFYMVASTALAAVTFLRLNMLIDLSGWQKLEIFCVAAGVTMLVTSYVALFREEEGRREDAVTFALALGSFLAVAPLVIAVLYHRWSVAAPSLYDEIALLTVTIVMTVTGVAWQVKATTMWGGAALVLYLVVMVCSLAYHPQVAVGVYMAAGGAVVFAIGIALSVYREKLLQLPDRVAKREGVFRILNWR